jgi:serine protease inhibitor
MKPYIALFLLIFMISAVSCKKDSTEEPKQPRPINLPAKADQIIASSNSFGIDLFRVTALEEDNNMMLSPLSASTALTLLLNGCNTRTYEQIRDMLGYKGLTLDEINSVYQSLVSQLLEADPEVKLTLANAVFYRQDFDVKTLYIEAMNKSFEAEIAALDFLSPSALETINGWASDNTNGKITKVLDEIDPAAVMFLMNALYFKGTWTYKFMEEQTSDAPFTLEDGNVITVDMMKSLLPVKMYYDGQATALELPYGRQNFSMVIILPDASLNEYLPDFDETDWTGMTSGLDEISEPSEAELLLPKFKFDYEKFLNDQLKSLGMMDAFNSLLADLSGISDMALYVDFVKQNTFVDVNEEGTEAAAVTTIGINYTSLPPTFTVDKPFIFAIRERVTNTLLFIGKMEHPEY